MRGILVQMLLTLGLALPWRGGLRRAAGAVAATVLVVAGCGGKAGASAMLTPPHSATVAAATEPADRSPPPLATGPPEGEPLAPLRPGETLVRVLTANLDADDDAEQLLGVQVSPAPGADSVAAPIKVVVLDFDGTSLTYRRTWEAMTQASDVRTFDLQVQDLLGDHRREIVARGINAGGERTLDGYRQSPGAGAALTFTSIAALAARGTIEIEERAWSESYLLRQSTADPLRIVASAADPGASEANDVIRTSYFWQGGTGRYEAAPAERVPGAFVEGRLHQLFASSGTAEFEGYLAGPWYRITQPDAAGSLVGRMEIIHFEPTQRRITLFNGEVQEIYTWDVSHRLMAPRLGIWVHNELVTSIEKTINVEVVAGDEIRVAMKGRDQGDFADGNYRKLSDQARTALVRSGTVRPESVDLNLTGLYRASAGQSINFEPPRFSWLSGDDEISGGFAVYSVGQPVIVFKVLSAAGVTRELRTYTLDYREQRRGERLLRSIVLRPAALTITGVTTASDAALHFEQVEIIDPTAPQDHAGAAAGEIIITPASAVDRQR